MIEINELFFQLIRVAIGNADSLSYTPSDKDWKALYDMAKKQSLVGVCFAALQRLGADADEGFAQIGISERLYLTWMGMAAKIQQRNQIVDEQCIALHKRLYADGMQSCILKGQGVGQKYVEQLRGLRQSGDIDVWVQNKSIEELAEYVKKLGVAYKATAAHVESKLFEDTDVELHSAPAFMRCFWHDRRLRTWFKKNNDQTILSSTLNINVPTDEFNLVYMMVHMYHHVLFEGLGVRQLMDYYFVLRASHNIHNHYDYLMKTLSSLGILKFAEGIMWIMKEVFALEDKHLICEANEKYGKLILADVMNGGNFGHHDKKNKDLHGGTAVGRSLNGLKRNMKFFALGPWEVLCSPLWSTWHHFWRKKRKYKKNKKNKQ